MKKKIILKEADFKNLVKQTILEWGNGSDEDYDPRFNHYGEDEWGDEESDKYYDNEASWDELEDDTDERNKRLGSNAQDIFDGNYDDDPDIDYFKDSDYRYTNNYWDDKDLTDIQKDRIAHDWKEKDRQHEAVIHKITESILKRLKR